MNELLSVRINNLEFSARRKADEYTLATVRQIRALMAENVELYAALDKTKKAVSDATELLNEVLK